MAIRILSSLNIASQMTGNQSVKASAEAVRSVASTVSSTLAAVVTVNNVGRAANGKGAVPTDFKQASKLADNLADRIKDKENDQEARGSFDNIGTDSAMTIFR